ncbi:MAG TPA: hypothetical protein PLM80_11235 [Mesotoga sp.]|jgi:hypothetical protein|nr:hypothetical protein [Mesotoga sp.]MDI9374988.1 hypothetical protein [Thermotogota bacterium]NLX34976.1 hypothetical protein [Thermotogaceae bacterium]MDD4040261.1 hypothetical protein [Mesotoga sp.]MDD5743588.1 hypothetical protein [Mesotoga sp.]
MERVFFTVLLTIFVVALAASLTPYSEATFSSYLQDGAYVYGGSVMLGWDVTVRGSSLVLNNIDIWFSSRNSGGSIGIKSAPYIEVVSYNVYLGTTPTPQLYTSTASNRVMIDRLSPNMTYYWQIVAVDRNGKRYSGPIWYFVTR